MKRVLFDILIFWPTVTAFGWYRYGNLLTVVIAVCTAFLLTFPICILTHKNEFQVWLAKYEHYYPFNLWAMGITPFVVGVIIIVNLFK